VLDLRHVLVIHPQRSSGSWRSRAAWGEESARQRSTVRSPVAWCGHTSARHGGFVVAARHVKVPCWFDESPCDGKVVLAS
jgi:hypothetical protein